MPVSNQPGTPRVVPYHAKKPPAHRAARPGHAAAMPLPSKATTDAAPLSPRTFPIQCPRQEGDGMGGGRAAQGPEGAVSPRPRQGPPQTSHCRCQPQRLPLYAFGPVHRALNHTSIQTGADAGARKPPRQVNATPCHACPLMREGAALSGQAVRVSALLGRSCSVRTALGSKAPDESEAAAGNKRLPQQQHGTENCTERESKGRRGASSAKNHTRRCRVLY